MFSAAAQQGDERILLQVTEAVYGSRTVTARLCLEHAGTWLITVWHTCTCGAQEGATPTVLTTHQVVVEEATASAACSRLSGFWPPQGALAGMPAAFTIQVNLLDCSAAPDACLAALTLQQSLGPCCNLRPPCSRVCPVTGISE